MASVSPSDFTIVVPTRNRPTTMFETLNYLRNELKWENSIIVIDQSDDHGEQLRSLLDSANFEGITFSYRPERGTSVGRNVGAKSVTTNWIFFLDDDVRPNRLYLHTVAAFLDENPWIDVLQPAVRQLAEWTEYAQDPDGWMRRNACADCEREKNPKYWEGIRWFQTRIPSGYDSAAIGLGTAFVISRRSFFGVGGFDQTLVGQGDDRELAVRLWWYGYRIHQLPHAVGFHLREAEGGTRTRPNTNLPRTLARVLEPVPDPGILYLYGKWFPGYPAYFYICGHLLHCLKNPLLFPAKLLQLVIGIWQVRALIRSGPRYIDDRPPLPRSQALRTAGSNE